MNKKEIVENAISLISDEKCWTQRALCRDANGKNLNNALSKDAVCWCAMGALEKASGDSSGPEMISLRREISNYRIIDINDFCGREAVIKRLQDYLQNLA